MKKKKIIQLALASYKGKNLDEKKVNAISSYLGRSDLKKYINALKNLDNNKKLVVSSPTENFDTKSFEKLFPEKRIVFKKDPSLLLGIQIIDNGNSKCNDNSWRNFFVISILFSARLMAEETATP